MSTKSDSAPETPTEVIDALQRGEHAALEAVQRFVDAVDEAVPDLQVGEDVPARRQITDAAFRMADELIGTSNDFARSMVRGSEQRLRSGTGSSD